MILARGEGLALLGHYENFPTVIHSVARFIHDSTTKKLQRATLRALHRLNQETYNLNAVSPRSTSRCEVSFEFGVAEGITFNYLDREELDKFQKAIIKKSPPTLDFFCVIRYHTLEDVRRVPLRFDYHMLRFVFHSNSVEMQISHERGIRRVSLEDLTSFIIEQIIEELPQKKLNPLTPSHLHAL